MQPSVKVAQPGWNVNTCPDWALVYSNQWPSLTIGFEVTIQNTVELPVIDNTPYVTHNLNFPPLTLGWVTLNGINYGRISSVFFSVDKQNIYLDMNILSGMTLTIRCYNIDISQEASYPLPQSAAAKLPPDLTTSIKVVKTGRSINSKNLNDFILNSQAQSPAVLEVATSSGQYYSTTATIDGNAIVYPLQTSYVPWVSGAYLVSGTKNTYAFFSINDMTLQNNSVVLDLGEPGQQGSLIILRDPLFYPNTVRIVY